MVGVVAGFHHFDGFVYAWIELLSLRRNGLYTETAESIFHLLADQLDARTKSCVGSLGLLTAKRQIEIVEHGKEGLYRVCRGVFSVVTLLAQITLARVLEFGLKARKAIEQRIALFRHSLVLLLRDSALRLLCKFLRVGWRQRLVSAVLLLVFRRLYRLILVVLDCHRNFYLFEFGYSLIRYRERVLSFLYCSFRTLSKSCAMYETAVIVCSYSMRVGPITASDPTTCSPTRAGAPMSTRLRISGKRSSRPITTRTASCLVST